MIDKTEELNNKLLKKYEMLSCSLNLLKDEEQKNNVYFELGKVLNKIIESTNSKYEEEYNELLNMDVEGFKEEKNKLLSLIELIKSREEYINSLLSKHYVITSKRLDEPSFLGKFDLSDYENKIEVINNYLDNVSTIQKYNEEVDKLNSSIELAKEKIEISNALNNEMEVKLKDVFDEEFSNRRYFKLKENEEEICNIYKELEFILNIAEENIKVNNSLSYDLEYKEQNEYEEIEELYLKYKEKVVVLELLDIYDKKTKNYDELIEKRNKINEILNKISNSDLYYSLNEFLKEQYTTLLRQKEDVKTLKSLEEEKKYKLSLIEEKKEENNSEIYSDILAELKKEEEKIREKKLLEQKKEEELNRQRLIEEQKERQEEIKRRQKLIEEQRKKEMEERAKKILQEQNKYSKKNVELEESKEKISEIVEEKDEMIDNPIFKDIKNELEYNDLDINNSQEKNIGLNDFNNISNMLPDDLDNYMKKFETDGNNKEFEDTAIFIDL